MNEKIDIVKNKKGFIAALDQSSGSSEKVLYKYGVKKDRYKKEEEKQNIMHEMRKRVLTNRYFSNDKIIGVILFEEEIERKIEGKCTPDYLWNQKRIPSFVKIDEGLSERKNGTQLMNPITNLEKKLNKAKKHGIIGTKMRSVIYENNEEGIKKIVKQQFDLAKQIYSKGLIPIIEPEVNINAKEKEKCEETLKKLLDRQIKKLGNTKIILKLTLPDKDNLYEEYTKNDSIIRVIALSGGYDRNYACEKLANNKNVIASFSKALLEGLKEFQNEEEYTSMIKNNIKQIYEASIS